MSPGFTGPTSRPLVSLVSGTLIGLLIVIVDRSGLTAALAAPVAIVLGVLPGALFPASSLWRLAGAVSLAQVVRIAAAVPSRPALLLAIPGAYLVSLALVWVGQQIAPSRDSRIEARPPLPQSRDDANSYPGRLDKRARLGAVIGFAGLVVVAWVWADRWAAGEADDRADQARGSVERVISGYEPGDLWPTPEPLVADLKRVASGATVMSSPDATNIRVEVGALWARRCVRGQITEAGTKVDVTAGSC